MSTPSCPGHPEARVLLLQYMEGNLSWICLECGVDLPEVVAPSCSEIRIKVLAEDDELAQTA